MTCEQDPPAGARGLRTELQRSCPADRARCAWRSWLRRSCGCAVVAALASTGACTGDAGNESTAGAPLPTGLEQELRIDGYEEDLVPISWLGVSPDGHIALIAPQDHGVRFFDDAGTFLGLVGRDGEGPGEFRRPVRGGWIGDTLWVSDVQLERVTLISPAREVVATLRPPPLLQPRDTAAGVGSWSLTFPYGMTARDSLVMMAAQPMQPAGDAPGAPVMRVTGDGAIHHAAWVPTDGETSVRVDRGDGIVFGRVPFTARSTWAVSPDGRRVGILTTDMSDVDRPSFTVRVYDETGRETVNRVFTFDPVPIPSSLLDSAIDAVAARHPDVRADMAARLHDAAPAIYPEAERILLGTDGSIWIGLRQSEQGRPWRILAEDGDDAGRIVLPANATLHAATRSHVWVTERDEVDVESVVRYRLRSPQND